MSGSGGRRNEKITTSGVWARPRVGACWPRRPRGQAFLRAGSQDLPPLPPGAGCFLAGRPPTVLLAWRGPPGDRRWPDVARRVSREMRGAGVSGEVSVAEP
eukprot:6208032-Pyramimonas_sp.AAC.1